MCRGITLPRLRLAIVLAGLTGWSAIPVAAQAPARAASGGSVETTPMNCWWMTDKGAVRVGELFGLTLTCRVMETGAVKVVPNLSELEPTSIELTPFEVLQGTRHDDLVAPPWRYIQYVYTMRLMGDEFFGRDIPIPATNLTFRIQTGGAETVEGAEHRYVLPPMPMRILSLLPAQAADIRDPAVETFGDLETRRSRATMELVASAIFFAFAAVAAIVAVIRIGERYRQRGPAVQHTVPVGQVLGGCVREIDGVRAEALRDGWSSGLAARALAAFRVGGAIALKQPVAQTLLNGVTPTREGQLAVRHGLLRRRHAVVSASITADAMDRVRVAGNGNGPVGAGREDLDQIRDALAALSAVRYSRAGQVDVQALDRTLDNGCSALRRLRKAQLWPVRAAAALSKATTLFGTGA
jgi:hypothetical protein